MARRRRFRCLVSETKRIEADLAADVDRARKILAEKLGKITVEERDDGVYAQVDIGPVLREAAGPMFLGLVAGVRNRSEQHRQNKALASQSSAAWASA